MSNENNKVEINKHEIDIGTLFKQNVNDLLAIKELYRKLKEIEEKIRQIKYIDNALVKKLKNEYENFKKLILDENLQLQFKTLLKENNKVIDDFNARLDNDINEINSQLDNIANKGTTVEVLERATKEEIERLIQDGTIANLTIEDGSINYNKLDKALKNKINKIVKEKDYYNFEAMINVTNENPPFAKGVRIELEEVVLDNLTYTLEVKIDSANSENIKQLTFLSDKSGNGTSVDKFNTKRTLTTNQNNINIIYEYTMATLNQVSKLKELQFLVNGKPINIKTASLITRSGAIYTQDSYFICEKATFTNATEEFVKEYNNEILDKNKYKSTNIYKYYFNHGDNLDNECITSNCVVENNILSISENGYFKYATNFDFENFTYLYSLKKGAYIARFELFSNAYLKLDFINNNVKVIKNDGTEIESYSLNDFYNNGLFYQISVTKINDKIKVLLKNNLDNNFIEFNKSNTLAIVSNSKITSLSGSVIVNRISFSVYENLDNFMIITGDSITKGVGCDFDYRWAINLKKYLNSNVLIYARSGCTSSNILNDLLKTVFEKGFTAKYVLVSIGTNDWNIGIEQHKNNIKNIAKLILDNGAIPIFAIPPCAAQLYSGIYDNYKNNDYNIVRFDIPTSVNDLCISQDNSLFYDGIHPNNKGNLKMYDRLLNDLNNIFLDN